MRKPDRLSMWECYDVDSHGCWNWRYSKNSRGYGKIVYNRRLWGVHRLSYYLTYGEIPPGMNVCHRCDNPSCYNPDHLFLGTQSDNLRDMTIKGRRASIISGGENIGTAKLSLDDVEKIRSLLDSGMYTYRQIADMYSVSRSAIIKIKTGKSWAKNIDHQLLGYIGVKRFVDAHS